MLLGLLGQAGLFAGLAALACMLIPAWLAFSRTEETDKGRWPERLAIIAGVGAWSAHSLVDLSVQVPGTLITVACLPLLALRERPADDEPAGVATSWQSRLGGAGQLILAGIALLGIWRLPGERAFQIFDTQMRNRAPLQTLMEQGRSASRLLPTSSNPDRMLGYIAEATRNPQAAVAAYERAVSRAPHRAGLWDRLARARLGAGDLVGAGAAIRLALEWNPGHASYQAHSSLISGLRGEKTLPHSAKDLVAMGFSADYGLDREGSDKAMVVQVLWPPKLPPPAIPIDEFAAWLNQHAGEFTPAALPVRFE
jgi:tetratricopeptide (TPR) repeat protein